MAGTIKTADDITLLREGGKRLAHVVAQAASLVVPGVSTAVLDARAEALIREGGDTPAFLGYTPRGAKRAYPATICISVNNEVVHGIPNEAPRTIQDGDIVSLDCGLVHHGLIVDHAVTVVVGEREHLARLAQATREALAAGINAARGGAHVGDIGAAIDEVAEQYGFGNVYQLGGHGVGYAVHEEPFIQNSGRVGEGEELVPGMVLAIEPMFTEGAPEVKLTKDGYTYVTKDGGYAAHFEHTILITDGVPEIFTKE